MHAMGNRYDDLILHLKLDDIDSTNTTPDSSKSGLKAKVNGASLVKDDTFGACLNFQGQADHVEVSSVDLAGENPPHTIEGWIKLEAYPQTVRSWILLLGQADQHSHHWLLNTETAQDLGKKAQLGHWGLDSRYQAKPKIPLAEWVHLATTFDGLNYICYVNGEAIDKQEHYKFTLTDKRLTLGKTGIATEKNFQGKMADVRIYRRALSQAEIREDKNADKDDLVLLLAMVRSTLVELGDGWRQYLMRTQKIDIRASDLAGELSKVRPINREEPGFADFDPSGNRAIEPGNLARSLLYHALASPDVHPTLDDDSAIADRDYPTWRQLDVIENYIYSLAPFSKNDLKDAVVGVFAYEYRPRAATTHGQHADVNFSRMGIARIGTSEAVYKGAERAYTSITGTTGKIGVLPARYGAFLARKVKGGRDLSLLGEGDGGDGQRTFLLPFRKLFSGKECIPNRDITLSFGEHHRAEKLSRIVHGVQAINGGKGSCVPDGFDVTRPPFIRRSPDPDLVRMTPVGAGVMISAPPHPLVRRAEQNVGGRMLPAMFRVPAESITGEALSEFKPDAGAGNYRHYTALQLPVGDVALSFEGVQVLLGRADSQSRFARNFPFFVYIREEVEYWKGNYNLVDLNKLNDDEFYRYVRNGIYYAAMFEDSTSDGCVVAFVDGLGSNLESCPAFSVVAPLTFFPRSVELDLECWTLQHPDMFHQGDSRPLCEGRFYANPSIVLPTRDGDPSATPAFREQDNTIAAVVGKPPGARNAPSAAPELRKVFRTSFMTDAASNVFFPGWDVTIASRTGDIADKNFFYTTYGMGSPYPEDVKFCAAANGFWPTASPDAGRTFHRSDSPTSIFLVDDELGYHPSHPAAKGDQPGWDGGYGPFFQLDARTGAPGVNFANLDRVDYVRDALEGKFGRIQFAHLTSDVLIERMSCQRRCVEVLKQTYFPKEPDMGVVSKTRLWLISAQRVEKSPDLDDEPGYLLVYALSSGPKRSLPGADGRYTRRWEPIQNSVYVCRAAPSGKNKTWKIDAVDWTKTRWKTFT
jgi:hypothetical protein